MPQRKKCVVVWELHGKIYAYPPYVATEEEALRKAAGVFTKLRDDKSTFARARNESSVYWDGDTKYEKYLPIALEFKKQYEEIRDRDNAQRALDKVAEKQQLICAKATMKRSKQKTNPDQVALF